MFGDNEKALLVLNLLSYTSSHYVALWSKLIVLKIHSDLGNERLTKKLIDRANRYLKNNFGKIFTRDASILIIEGYSRLSTDKMSTNTNQKFYFFDLLSPNN